MTVSGSSRVAIAANNATVPVWMPFPELEVAELEKTWGVSLWDLFHRTQLAARVMVQQGRRGNFVNIHLLPTARRAPAQRRGTGSRRRQAALAGKDGPTKRNRPRCAIRGLRRHLRHHRTCLQIDRGFVLPSP